VRRDSPAMPCEARNGCSHTHYLHISYRALHRSYGTVICARHLGLGGGHLRFGSNKLRVLQAGSAALSSAELPPRTFEIARAWAAAALASCGGAPSRNDTDRAVEPPARTASGGLEVARASSPRSLNQQRVESPPAVSRLGGGDRQLDLELVVAQPLDAVATVHQGPSGALVVVTLHGLSSLHSGAVRTVPSSFPHPRCLADLDEKSPKRR
jgi:hypothetical protein